MFRLLRDALRDDGTGVLLTLQSLQCNADAVSVRSHDGLQSHSSLSWPSEGGKL